MSTIPLKRASYQKINPHFECGHRHRNRRPLPTSETCYVYVKDQIGPVSTFPLTMRTCHILSQAPETSMSPFEIHALLVAGGRFRSYYDGEPCVITL